jgi:hypothetical protein
MLPMFIAASRSAAGMIDRPRRTAAGIAWHTVVDIFRRIAPLFVVYAVGCSSSDSPAPAITNDAGITDAGSETSTSCEADGKTYAHGSTWQCSDGCKWCSCSEGVVSTTTALCGCSDSTGFHPTGASWICPDGCNTCTCGGPGTITATLRGCDAGADVGDATSDDGSDAMDDAAAD